MMQFNTGYSESLERLIQHLPAAVSELSKNRSPFEAFEAGYVNGRKSVNMQVEDALLELPMSLNKDKKSCEEAYLKGVEIGQKVKSSIDYAKACLKGIISLPKIRKYQGMDRTPKYYYKINDKFVVSVSKGTISDYDFIARYWQFDPTESKWLKSRQPKHIHWAVDLLIKNEYDKTVVSMFVQQLIKDWNNEEIIRHITSKEELDSFLDPEELLKYVFVEAKRYSGYDIHGAYPMELLILLSRLLMTQERTNKRDAYMFKNLIDSFDKQYVDFFNVVDIATFRHR
jgi:hypothetical protein